MVYCFKMLKNILLLFIHILFLIWNYTCIGYTNETFNYIKEKYKLNRGILPYRKDPPRTNYNPFSFSSGLSTNGN